MNDQQFYYAYSTHRHKVTTKPYKRSDDVYKLLSSNHAAVAVYGPFTADSIEAAHSEAVAVLTRVDSNE